jgi:hypothetical protein
MLDPSVLVPYWDEIKVMDDEKIKKNDWSKEYLTGDLKNGFLKRTDFKGTFIGKEYENRLNKKLGKKPEG